MELAGLQPAREKNEVLVRVSESVPTSDTGSRSSNRPSSPERSILTVIQPGGSGILLGDTSDTGPWLVNPTVQEENHIGSPSSALLAVRTPVVGVHDPNDGCMVGSNEPILAGCSIKSPSSVETTAPNRNLPNVWRGGILEPPVGPAESSAGGLTVGPSVPLSDPATVKAQW